MEDRGTTAISDQGDTALDGDADVEVGTLDSGLRRERDRLLRELVYLRTGQMIGGGGDDLDAAEKVASQHLKEIELLRADLATTIELLRSAQADDKTPELLILRQDLASVQKEAQAWRDRSHALEDEVDTLYAESTDLTHSVGRLTSETEALRARVRGLETSTSWRVTAPLRYLTNRL